MFRVCSREGNGCVARLLATLMALQAGLPPLDFGELKGKKRKEYFAAIRAESTNLRGQACDIAISYGQRPRVR